MFSEGRIAIDFLLCLLSIFPEEKNAPDTSKLRIARNINHPS